MSRVPCTDDGSRRIAPSPSRDGWASLCSSRRRQWSACKAASLIEGVRDIQCRAVLARLPPKLPNTGEMCLVMRGSPRAPANYREPHHFTPVRRIGHDTFNCRACDC